MEKKIRLNEKKIAYVVANLKQIGPTNQTLNIIKYSGSISNCIVITLFNETKDSMIQEYKKNNINVLCLNLNKKNVFLKGIFKLRKCLLDNNIKLVHSWGTIADIISYYSCKNIKLKHIITLRNFPVEEMTSRMNKYLGLAVANINLYILKKCKYVIACSKSIEMKMKDTYDWKHIKSIQNGVDCKKFNPRNKSEIREELKINQRDTIYISAGSFIPRKRIEETIQAFIRSKDIGFKQLWFIGEGVLFKSISEKYKDYPMIRFWGKQKDVSYFLSAADIFVSSSESEGLPNAVIESIACGLPVFLSDIPQHMEILNELPLCGYSYRLGEIKELQMLFENVDYNQILQMKSYCSMIKDSNLTAENMGRKYEQYYESIL